MSDEKNDQQNRQSSEGNSQPSQPQHGGETVNQPDPDAGLPAWARGKSKADIAREMEELYQMLPNMDFTRQQPQQQRGNTFPAQTATNGDGGPAPSPSPGPHEPPQPLPPNPELARTDPEKWRQEFDRYNRALVNASLEQIGGSRLEPIYRSQAQSAREMSRGNPRYTKVWERYGHEIDREIAKIPFEQRSIEAYNYVADAVKGRHAEELFASPAPSQNGNDAPSNATASNSNSGDVPKPPPREPLDELWDTNHPHVRRMRDAGITKTQLRDKIRAMGQTEKSYVESIQRGNSVFVDNVSDSGKRTRTAATAAAEG